MRLKYFMRGLGSGIVLTTVVLALTMKAPSNAQIIERAIKLGMVKEEEGLSTEELAELKDKSNNIDVDDTLKENTSSGTENNTDNKTDNKSGNSKNNTEVDKTEESNNTTKETNQSNDTDEIQSEKEDTNNVSSNEKEKDTTQNTDGKTDEVKNTSTKNNNVDIYKGMHSYSVAKLLEEQGIIDNAKDFDQYLVEAGFQYKIQQGTYQFKAGTSYDQILETITK